MVEGVQQGPVLVGTFFTPSMCLRTQTQLCRPLSGPVSCPSLMDLSILYPFVT